MQQNQKLYIISCLLVRETTVSAMSVILKYSALISLLAYVITNTIPLKLSKCEIATQFRNKGFNQHDLRFSLCYAQLKKFEFSALAYYKEKNSKAILLYGMFPITTPWCANSTTSAEMSICKSDCQQMLDNDIEDDILCLKKIFSVNLTEPFSNYMQHEKKIAKKCMTSILDECCFSGTGGQTDDCQPIFVA